LRPMTGKSGVPEGKRERKEPVSLAPVPFEEAVADLLKVKKPQEKKKRKTSRRRGEV
jgi:hypothetical protein